MPTNLANWLTIARMLLLPPIILLLFVPLKWAAWTVLALYIAGAVTDWLDGWVARRYNQHSEFGRFLDPISDKIFVITLLIMLVAVDHIQGIWVIAVIVILVREFLVAGLREFLGPKDVKLPVTNLAKWKTATQMIATGFLIIGPHTSGLVHLAGELGLAAAAALTAVTGWHYIKAALPHISMR